MDTPALIRVDSIAYEFMAKRDVERAGLIKVFAYLVDGWRDLNVYHIPNSVFKKVALDSNAMLSFPPDAISIDHVFVAVDGELKRLSRNNGLVPTTSLVDGVVVRNPMDGENQPIDVDSHGKNAEAYNAYGYYTVDNRSRQLLFLTDAIEVILAYTTSGLQSYDTLIPVIYKGVLLDYIRWMYSLDNKESGNMVDYYHNIYKNNLTMLRNVVVAYSLEDLAVAAMTNVQIPRRYAE